MTDFKRNGFTILTLHHLSGTGGTLISKCLAAMPDVVLLSEVYPKPSLRRFNPFDPIQQFAKYKFLDVDEMENIFLNRISLIVEKCKQHQKSLIIRDHSHSDFLVKSVPKRLKLLELLKTKYDVKPAITLRNPIDSWLAMRVNNWCKNVETFDNFCSRYLLFLDMYQDAPRFLYEEFVNDPERALEQMCLFYGIHYDVRFKEKFFEVKLSGDSGRSSNKIEPRPRRKHGPEFVEEVKLSRKFQEIRERLGYDGF